MIVMSNEYKRGFIQMLIWSLVCSLIVALFLLLYYFSGGAGLSTTYGDFLNKLPDPLTAFLGFNKLLDDDFYYYLANAYRPILALSCFYATKLGLASISAEDKKGTSSFLYSFPVSRFQIVAQKILGTLFLYLTFCVIVCGVTIGLTLLAVPEIVLIDLLLNLALLISSIFLVGFVYCLIGFLISSKPKTLRSPSFVSLCIIFLGMLISAAAENSQILQILSYFFPYSYALPLEIINTGMSILHYILAVGISLLCIGLTLILQRKKPYLPA